MNFKSLAVLSTMLVSAPLFALVPGVKANDALIRDLSGTFLVESCSDSMPEITEPFIFLGPGAVVKDSTYQLEAKTDSISLKLLPTAGQIGWNEILLKDQAIGEDRTEITSALFRRISTFNNQDQTFVMTYWGRYKEPTVQTFEDLERLDPTVTTLKVTEKGVSITTAFGNRVQSCQLVSVR